MIDQATIDKIRRLRRQGSVLKNIATMCNVSLNTVKKYVKDTSAPTENRGAHNAIKRDRVSISILDNEFD